MATNQQAILNLLGIAMRAGKLVTGEELAVKAIQKGQAKFVFVAADASQNTMKKIKDKSLYYQVLVNDTFDMLTLSSAIGRKRSVIVVADEGFAKKFTELIKG
ncbi:YlxQ-related RNA-binding protein [Enterococcus sp. LJL120]